MTESQNSPTESNKRVPREMAEKERHLIEHHGSMCPECGGVVFDWWDHDRCKSCETEESEPDHQQTKLVTDGGHDEGLYGKYEVYEDGEPVENCFVLEPGSDEAARQAIYEYAKATDNQKLASELRGWMEAIEQEVA